jgi:hypothetical protein
MLGRALTVALQLPGWLDQVGTLASGASTIAADHLTHQCFQMAILVPSSVLLQTLAAVSI